MVFSGSFLNNFIQWNMDMINYHRVKLNASLNHTMTIREGVTSGVVISPKLFVVFIEIKKGLTNYISWALYADDIAMLSSKESSKSAKFRMPSTDPDGHINQNALKTMATLFSLSNKNIEHNLTVMKIHIPQEQNPTY